MDDELHLIIYKGNIVFDNFTLSSNVIVRVQNTCKKHPFAGGSVVKVNAKCIPVKLNRRGFDAYLASAYIAELEHSDVYRRAAVKVLLRFVKLHVRRPRNTSILMKLRTPRRQYLDYKWNERITHMISERREVDHAMSWLSTLGGGFSALGEEFQHCAEMAGKISVKQLELALRLQDPLLVARCKLYGALSLLQRGALRVAEQWIRNIYKLAIDEKDVRLQKMCKGVWAKLQYTYKMKRQMKRR